MPVTKQSTKDLKHFLTDASEDESSSFAPKRRRSSQEKLQAHLRDNPYPPPPKKKLGDLLKFLEETLKILQWNVCKSWDKQKELLEQATQEPDKNGWDFIAIQEASKHSKRVPCSGYDKVEHTLLDDGSQPVWWYVSKNIPRDRWRTEDISCGCKDHERHDQLISSLRIESTVEIPIFLHNVYNRGKCLPAKCVKRRIEKPGLHVMVGDFNLHNPLWGGRNMTQRPEKEGKQLVAALEPHMQILVSPNRGGTFKRRQHDPSFHDIIDLAWMSRKYLNRFVYCEPRPDLTERYPTADHTPYEIAINMTVAEEDQPSLKAWEKADKAKAETAFNQCLAEEGELPDLKDVRSIDLVTGRLTKALEAATNTVPDRPAPNPADAHKVAPETKEALARTEQTGRQFREAEESFAREHAANLEIPTGDDIQTSESDDSDSDDSMSEHSHSCACYGSDVSDCDDSDPNSDLNTKSDNDLDKIGDPTLDSDLDDFNHWEELEDDGDDDWFWNDTYDDDNDTYDDDNDTYYDANDTYDDDNDTYYDANDTYDDNNNTNDDDNDTYDADNDCDNEDNEDNKDNECDDEHSDADYDSNKAWDNRPFDDYGRFRPDMRLWTEGMRDKLGNILEARKAQEKMSDLHETWKDHRKDYSFLKYSDGLLSKRRKLAKTEGISLLQKWKATKTAGNARTPAVFQQVEIDDNGSRSADPKDINRVVMKKWFPRSEETFEHQPIASTKKDESLISKKVDEQQIRRLLRLLKSRKATGLDGISNEILKLCEDVLVPYLIVLFRACIQLEYFPTAWRIEKIIALHKKTPESLSYGNPGDWRPISLLSCLGKLFEAFLAMLLTDFAFEHKLVPKTQFGSARRSTVSALIYLMEIIRAAWGRGKAVTILSLDLSGAFPNTDRPSLLETLHTKGVPAWMVNILGSFFTNRQAQLCLPGHKSELLPLHCGIPQGSPLSPILFALFSSGLLDIDKTKYGKPNPGEDIFMFSYVDDTYMVAVSDSWTRNNDLLEHAHGHPLQWANAHKAVFSPPKYQVLHLTQCPQAHPPPNTIPKIDGLTVNEDDKRKDKGYNVPMTIVGVTIAKNLKWDDHVNTMRSKAATMRGRFAQLAAPTWGPGLHALRNMYITSIRATFTYAAAAWYVVKTSTATGFYAPPPTLLNRIEPLQNRFLRSMSGAFIGTRTTVVQNEVNIESLHAYMRRLAISTRARLFDSEVWETIQEARLAIEEMEPGTMPIKKNPADELDKQAQELRTRALGPDGVGNRKPDAIRRAINKVANQDAQSYMRDVLAKDQEEHRANIKDMDRWPAVLHEESGWGPHNLARYKDLSKEESAVLLQLRSEAIGLRAWLKRKLFGDNHYAYCQLCKPSKLDEDVEHVLFQCKPRKPDLLFKETGCLSKKQLLTDPKLVGLTAKWGVKHLELDQLEWMRKHGY